MNYTNNQTSTQPSHPYNQTPTQASQWSSATSSSSNQILNSTYPPRPRFNPYNPFPLSTSIHVTSVLLSSTSISVSAHEPYLIITISTGPVLLVFNLCSLQTGILILVTNVSQNIQQATPFEGPDQITISNGQGLNINASGVSSFHSPFNSNIPLTLKNLLFVHSVTKNLLSVSQFCKDNSFH